MPQQHFAFTRTCRANEVFVINSLLAVKPMFTNYRKYYRKYFVLERSTSELAGYYRLTSKISCDNYHLYGLQKN